MNLSTATDDDSLMHRLVSENGLIHMGIYRVIYGFRVRAGFVRSSGFCLDWCGGGNWDDVQRLYSICRAILLKRLEDRECFKDLIPYSQVKPFYNDFEFLEHLVEKSGEFEMVKLPVPEISAKEFGKNIFGRYADSNPN